MKPFHEDTCRYDLPGASAHSIVIDAGGYEANWGRLICEKYGCRVHIFEPVQAFYDQIKQTLEGHPQRDLMTVHRFGISGTSRPDRFIIKGCMSGLYADQGPVEQVTLLGINHLMELPKFRDKRVSCLKLNIEASEYEVLERLIDEVEEPGLIDRFDTIHVQWHSQMPNHAARRPVIEAALEKAGFARLWERGDYDTGWDGFSRLA